MVSAQIAAEGRRYAGSVEKERRRLSEAEANAREERLKAMGVTVERPTTSTITLLSEATAEFDEFAPERDDDGAGRDE